MVKRIERFGEGGLEKIKKGKNRGDESRGGRPEGKKTKGVRPSDKVGYDFHAEIFQAPAKIDDTLTQAKEAAGGAPAENEETMPRREAVPQVEAAQDNPRSSSASPSWRQQLAEIYGHLSDPTERGLSGGKQPVSEKKGKKKVAAAVETKDKVDKDEELRNLFHLYLSVPLGRIDNYREYPADIRMQIDETINLLRKLKVSDAELGQIKVLSKEELQRVYEEKKLMREKEGEVSGGERSPFEDSGAEKLVRAALGEDVFEKEIPTPLAELPLDIQLQLDKFCEEEISHRRGLDSRQRSVGFLDRADTLKGKLQKHFVSQGNSAEDGQRLANEQFADAMKKVFSGLREEEAIKKGTPPVVEVIEPEEESPNLEELHSALYKTELTYLRGGEEGTRIEGEGLKNQILDYFISQGKSQEEAIALATAEVGNIRTRAIEALKAGEVPPQRETTELTEEQLWANIGIALRKKIEEDFATDQELIVLFKDLTEEERNVMRSLAYKRALAELRGKYSYIEEK